jgi:hypothetical protein
MRHINLVQYLKAVTDLYVFTHVQNAATVKEARDGHFNAPIARDELLHNKARCYQKLWLQGNVLGSLHLA